jgi:hypothetical protein
MPQSRKLRVIFRRALSIRLETVLDPGRLTVHDLAAAAAAAFDQDLADEKERAHAQV